MITRARILFCLKELVLSCVAGAIGLSVLYTVIILVTVI